MIAFAIFYITSIFSKFNPTFEILLKSGYRCRILNVNWCLGMDVGQFDLDLGF